MAANPFAPAAQASLFPELAKQHASLLSYLSTVHSPVSPPSTSQDAAECTALAAALLKFAKSKRYTSVYSKARRFIMPCVHAICELTLEYKLGCLQVYLLPPEVHLMHAQGKDSVIAALHHLTNDRLTHWEPRYGCAVALCNDSIAEHTCLHVVCLDAGQSFVHRC